MHSDLIDELMSSEGGNGVTGTWREVDGDGGGCVAVEWGEADRRAA